MTDAAEPVEVEPSKMLVKPAKSRKARSKQTASEKWRHMEESRAKIRERLIFVNRFENFHLDRHQKKLENKEERSLRNIFETKDTMKFSLIDLAKSRRHYKTKLCDYERKLRKGVVSPVFSKERERCRQKERDLRELRSRLEGPNSSVVAEHLKDELKMIEFRSLIGGDDLNTTKALPGIGSNHNNGRRASQNGASFGSLQMNNRPHEHQQGQARFAQSLSESSSDYNSLNSQTNPLSEPHQESPLDFGLKHAKKIVDFQESSSPRLPQISTKKQSSEEVPGASAIKDNNDKLLHSEKLNSKADLVESSKKENRRKSRKIFNKHSNDTAVSSDSKTDINIDSSNNVNNPLRLSPVVEDSDAEEELETDDLKDPETDVVDSVSKESNHERVERLPPINEDSELPNEDDEPLYDSTSSSLDTLTDAQAPPVKRSKKIRLRSKMKRKLLKDSDTVSTNPAANIEIARAERQAKKRLAEVKLKTDNHIDKLKTQGNNKTSPRGELDSDSDKVVKAASSGGYNPNKRKLSRSFESKSDSNSNEGGIRLPPIRVDVKLLKELKRQRAKHLVESVGLPTLP